MTDARFIAVVRWNTAAGSETGPVYAAPDGRMWVVWPDGDSDTVYRDTRGWLWSEYGDDEYMRRVAGHRRFEHAKGTRLPVVSRVNPASHDDDGTGY